MIKVYVFLALLVIPLSSQAQQYFDCARIAYFSKGCEPKSAQAKKPEHPVLPMWEPQTMSPTTPTVARNLLKDPTRENALAFAKWHLMRFIAMARAQEVLEQTMAEDESIQALQSYFTLRPQERRE